MHRLREYIRSIPDFPKQGIIFRDITTLLKDGPAWQDAVVALADPFRERGIEGVIGIEARGFIMGGAVACELGAGFIPVRKAGKLPAETLKKNYELEYGTDSLEVHVDAIKDGQRILMVDDLLATGGTMAACCEMVEELGGEIAACAFLIELCTLNGRDKLPGQEVLSLIKYDRE